MKWYNEFLIAVFVVVASFQLGWHWYSVQHFPMSYSLRVLYLHRSAPTYKGFSGWGDIILPSFLLGLAIGLIGPRRSTAEYCLIIVLMASGVTALFGVCVWLFNRGDLWWWPTDVGSRVLGTMRMFIESLLLTAFFTYMGLTFCKKVK